MAREMGKLRLGMVALDGTKINGTAPASRHGGNAKLASVKRNHERSHPMQPTTIGLDLAKNVFQVHAIAADGTVVYRRKLRRSELRRFFTKREPCLVGMEACASAHNWARELAALGYIVRLMPAAYVKPYAKRGKSDAIDAEAICEAVTRPTMRCQRRARISRRS